MAVRVISAPATAFAGDAEAVPLPPLVTVTVNSVGAALAITIDSSFVLLPALLVALTVKVAVPSAVGVPLISPVSAFRLRPAGRPPSMLHVIGAVPVAVRVWLYASPTLPSGRVSVVMVGAASGALTVTVQVAVNKPSCVVAVMTAVPPATAVTTPSSETVATVSLSEVQRTFLLVALSGVTVAARVLLPPTSRVMLLSFSDTPVTETTLSL